MKVRALRMGFDGRQRRRPGEVFEFAGKLGTWMEPVDTAVPLTPQTVRPEEPKPEPMAGSGAAVKARARREEAKPEPVVAAESGDPLEVI